ncbi:MAG: PhzF family phenazine biosynthesis protein [Ilumatobacteraceae bacterium]
MAWLRAGGVPRTPGVVVQECGVGLVTLVLDEASGRVEFAAPPLTEAELSDHVVDAMCVGLGLPRDAVVRGAVLSNGPTFAALELTSAEHVLAAVPDYAALATAGVDVGLIGPHSPGGPADVEVRLLMTSLGAGEDPVTGSLNAALAQWLMGAGALPESYTASQGTAIGRAGRLSLRRDDQGQVWVGGHAVCCVEGTVDL